MIENVEQAWDAALKEYAHRINKQLCQEGLSVWAGTDHRLVYIDCCPNTLDNLACVSQHPRDFVKPGRSGESQTQLYLQQALQALTRRDKGFLDSYLALTVPELAAKYDISTHACYCRVSAIRRKLKAIAKSLAERS